jgi:hypothetical protein
MTTTEFGEKLLSENLEKILFQEQDFNTIKDTLNNLLIGTIEPKTFKEVLVELRFKLLNELINFFPFYNERCKNNKDLDEFTSLTTTSEVKKRDELLTEVAMRLNTIYTRLKNNNGGIKNNPPTNEVKFVIDGANVALAIKTEDNKAKLSNIQMIASKLESLKIDNYVILCDKALRHTIDDKEEYMQYVNNNEIIETPAGTQADIFILQYARNKDAFIISNDRYQDYYDTYGETWIKEKRISFTIVGDEIYFDKELQKEI